MTFACHSVFIYILISALVKRRISLISHYSVRNLEYHESFQRSPIYMHCPCQETPIKGRRGVLKGTYNSVRG